MNKKINKVCIRFKRKNDKIIPFIGSHNKKIELTPSEHGTNVLRFIRKYMAVK
jgi:hypothetical protein